MILNSTGSTVTTVGEVTEHQISIDEKNREHIISILSTNLYSNPEQSFLREIVCNAIDAQVEAHSDEPAIISMANDSNSGRNIIAIRDYGTGISPERFKEIYLNIGSSTKRESNDFMGAFGIGRLSALSCANMCHITSYYHGIQYQYLMLKNGTKINVDLLSETPTTEHDGVEVKISVVDLKPYRYALRYLWFIPNVYVHDTSDRGYYYDTSRGEVSKFNERKLCLFNSFAYNNTEKDNLYVLLGNILYPVDQSYIPTDFKEHYDLNYVWPRIIPRFKIGELDITPNREQLLYSDKTKQALAAKYKEAAAEIITLLGQVSEKRFDNIFEYWKATNPSIKEIQLPNDKDVDAVITLHEDSYFRPFLKYKYRDGDSLADDKEIRRVISNMRYEYLGDFFHTLTVFENGGFYTQKQLSGSRCGRYNDMCMNELLSGKNEIRIIYVPSMHGLRSDIFREYLTEKCATINAKGRLLFVFTSDMPSIRKFIRKDGFSVTVTSDSSVIDWHKSLWLFREIRRSMSGKVYVYDIANSKDFVKYRTEVLARRKEERKSQGVQKFSSRTRFYVESYNKNDNYLRPGYKVDVDNAPHLINQVDYRNNKDVYWGIIGDSYVDIWRTLAIGHRGFMVVTVAKTNAKCLEKAPLPSNWHKITPELILDSREFRRWMTKKKFGVLPCGITTFQLMDQAQDSNTVVEIEKATNWRLHDSHNSNILNTESFQQLEAQYKGYYDQDMLAGYAMIAKYNEIAKSMKGIFELTTSYDKVSPLSAYVAMKRKLFRPKWDVYRKIVQSLNPKSTEGENNEENN